MAKKNFLESASWDDYIAPAAIIGAGLYFWSDIKNILFNPDKKKEKEAEKEAEKQEKQIPPNFSGYEYNLMADSLFTAFDGAGTAWNVVNTTIRKLKNSTDFWKLSAAFGIRKTTSYLSNFKGNLIQWLQDELSNSELIQIQTYLKSIGVNAA